jgi:hypothetical protein
VKISIVFIAGYNYLSAQKNIHVFLLSMAATVGVQLVAALRQRVLDVPV